MKQSRRRRSRKQSRRRRSNKKSRSSKQSRRRRSSKKSRLRTRSRKQSRRRRSSKQSRLRTRSRKQSRRRRSSKRIIQRFDGSHKCLNIKDLPQKNIPLKDIEEIAKTLLKYQNKRFEIIEKIKSNKATFGMYMRSKTKYGEKAIYSTPSDIKKMVYYIPKLVNILKNKFTNLEKKAFVFSIIDLGLRVEKTPLTNPPTYYPDNHNVNFIVNAIVYASISNLDWQYFLMTPMGYYMIQNMVYDITYNRDQLGDFIGMLYTASINGVNETDILVGIPKMGFDICDYIGFNSLKYFIGEYGINKVARMGQAFILKKITKKIINNI